MFRWLKIPLFVWWIIAVIMVWQFFIEDAIANNTRTGTIVSISETTIQKKQADAEQYIGTGAGAAIGYGVGSIFNNTVGVISAGVGALVGSVKTSKQVAYTFVVQTNDNQLITVTQLKNRYPNTKFVVGDQVYIFNEQGQNLITK